MPKILYIEASGAEHAVEVPAGWTVMEGAVKNSVSPTAAAVSKA